MPPGVQAYSMDLRERIVAAVDAGLTQAQAAERFGVSLRTVERYLARRRATGSLAPTAYRHGPRPEKTQRLQAWLPARLQVAADATLTEHAALADLGYEGERAALTTPIKKTTDAPLTADQRTVNLLHAATRAPGPRQSQSCRS